MKVFVDKEAEPVYRKVIDEALRSGGINILNAVNSLLANSVVSDSLNIESSKKKEDLKSGDQKAPLKKG